MKKIMFVMVILMTALASKAQKTFTVSGKLTGLADGTKINLVPGAEHKRMEPVAGGVIENGNFKLSYDIPDPRLFYLRAEGSDGQATLVIAPGENITLSGSLNNPVITGSKLNDKYVKNYVIPRAESAKANRLIREKYSAVSKRMGDARGKHDRDAIAAVETSAEWKAYNEESGKDFKKFNELMGRIARENKDSFWGPMLILAHTAYLTSDFEPYYYLFSEDVKKSYYGQRYAAAQFGAMGKAPAFTAKDAQGNSKSLSDIMNGKNYVLIDFWASWCVPCRKFLPKLTELANKYAGKGLVVVSISMDEKKDLWLKALEEEKMPWLNLLDESKISKTYGVTSIPSVYLIDPKGKILFGKQSGDILIKKLEEVFGAAK